MRYLPSCQSSACLNSSRHASTRTRASSERAYYVGQGDVSGEFETSAYKINEGVLSYYKLKTNVSNDGITIIDGLGNTLKVNTAGKLYNIMAREYQYDAGDATRANNLYTSSFAVIHQIDGALMYK